MKKTIALALAAAGILAGTPASAQFAKPDDAVKYRQSVMVLMGAHMGRIGAVVRGDKPFNAAEVQANAALVDSLAKVSRDGFVAGSGQVAGTKAKPEVWSQADKFQARDADMLKATGALAAAAKAGTPDAVKAAFGDVGKSCKGCHDDFRNK